MSEDIMQLTLAENSYTITKAELTAYVLEPTPKYTSLDGSLVSGLFWEINVEEGDERIRFYSQGFQLQNLLRWTDLVGSSISWNTPRNPVTSELDWAWYGGYLISGHHEILHGKFRFIEREEYKLRLQWEGMCSGAPLGCEPSPEERLPFAIDCWCVFKEVRASNREVLSQFLDLDDFDESAQEQTTGTLCVFKPRC